MKDELIPGTFERGLTLPAILEAFIQIAIVEVEAATLGTRIVAENWRRIGVGPSLRARPS